MSSFDTIPLMAVLLIMVVGVVALPWSQGEVAESARAFGTLGRWAASSVVELPAVVGRRYRFRAWLATPNQRSALRRQRSAGFATVRPATIQESAA